MHIFLLSLRFLRQSLPKAGLKNEQKRHALKMNCNSAEVRLLAGTGSVRLQRKQNTRLSMTVTQPFQYDKSNESPVAAVARGVGASVGCARHGIGSFVTIKKTTNILPRVRRWATSCVDTGDWCAAQSFFFWYRANVTRKTIF